MSSATILLPNQLFAHHPGLSAQPDHVVLFEDPLFFGDAIYPAKMHKQKLWLHRASMTRYRDDLVARGFKAKIWKYESQAGACMRLFEDLRQRGVSQVIMAEPVDYIGEKRLRMSAKSTDITLDLRSSPSFLNTRADNLAWSADRKRWFTADFYKSQRRRLHVLMDGRQPIGGQWSFDADNRRKVPKGQLASLPWIDWPDHDTVDHAAKEQILAEFPDALGKLGKLYYPTSHKAAADWLAQFLERRFDRFDD